MDSFEHVASNVDKQVMHVPLRKTKCLVAFSQNMKMLILVQDGHKWQVSPQQN